MQISINKVESPSPGIWDQERIQEITESRELDLMEGAASLIGAFSWDVQIARFDGPNWTRHFADIEKYVTEEYKGCMQWAMLMVAHEVFAATVFAYRMREGKAVFPLEEA